MNFLPVIIAEETAEATTTSAALSMLITFVPLVLVFYFLIIRPQKKRDKEEKAMRESLEIGDEIVTIGGIIGLVVRLSDDTVVIETGGDRSKLRLQKTAIKENITAVERARAASAEEKKSSDPDVSKKKSKAE